eukprot:7332343-Prymnesium_polylepis.1
MWVWVCGCVVVVVCEEGEGHLRRERLHVRLEGALTWHPTTRPNMATTPLPNLAPAPRATSRPSRGRPSRARARRRGCRRAAWRRAP